MLMKDNRDHRKMFNVRIPVELWSFLKKDAIDKEVSLNCLITTLADKYKKRCERKLTSQ